MRIRIAKRLSNLLHLIGWPLVATLNLGQDFALQRGSGATRPSPGGMARGAPY